jgi:hypothetical protein
MKAHKNSVQYHFNIPSEPQCILGTFVHSSEDLIISCRIRSGPGLGFLLRCWRCENELVCMLLAETLEL